MPTKIPVFSNGEVFGTDSERKILLDGDILRYQIGAVEMKHPFLEGEFIPASSELICNMVDELIERTCKACGTSNYIVFLSGKNNFRNEVAKQAPYKGNRNPNQTRPYHFQTVGDHLSKNHPFLLIDGKEADDEMGSRQFEDFMMYFNSDEPWAATELNTIIASRDKDLRTIPGLHYSWACGKDQPEKPLYYISADQAMHMFFYQMLIGDNTDNIIGCGKKELTKWGFEKDDNGEFILDEEGEKIPHYMLRRKGIGKTGALKILKKCKTIQCMLEAVTKEYEKVFKDEYKEVMLENARLLYIGQTPDNLFEWSWLDYALNLNNSNFEEETND